MTAPVRKTGASRKTASRKTKKKTDALKHQPKSRHTARATSRVSKQPMAWTDKQFTVYLPNKPGQMARLGRVLKRAKVNMVAMSVSEQADSSAVRFLVDNERATRQGLDRTKLHYDIRKVVLVRATNAPGVLGDIGAKLAKEKINVQYAYASTYPDALQALIVLAVDHTREAVNILA